MKISTSEYTGKRVREKAISRQPLLVAQRLLMAFGVLMIGTLLVINQAQAIEKNPKALLQSVSDNMIKALNDNRDKIKANPQVTQDLIEEILMPHLDFITAAKYVLGKHWDTSNKQQKIAFIKGFRTLLVRFYSSALTEYLNSHKGNLNPNIMVYHTPADIDKTQLTVRSEVIPKSGKPVPVNYQVRMTRKGWKIFDVSVEGVSVITTYKTSFASEIQQNGLDALIGSLKSRNQKLRTANNS